VRVDLLIPQLLWPGNDAADVMRGLAVPTLERWLARGTRDTRGAGIGVERWLWQQFAAPVRSEASGPGTLADAGCGAMPGADLPVAPLTLALDGGEPGQRWWLRADPVHLIVGRTGLRLAPPDTLQLAPEEAAALAGTLAAHFVEPRFALDPRTPRRWYLGADTPFLLHTTAPADAAQMAFEDALPRGADRLPWLAFLNEVQMLWFDHPVNRAREQRGEPVASSLWLHGGGRLPSGAAAAEFDLIAGGGALAAALARLAVRRHLPLPPTAATLLDGEPVQRALIVLDQPRRARAAGDPFAWRDSIERIERDWIVPLDQALRAGRLASLRVIDPQGAATMTLDVGRRDGLRLWRRPRPLASHA
jgi:hypothetical protein